MHVFLFDANYNVTASVLDSTHAVDERYAYTPYGEVTVLDADYSADADGISDIDNEFLYTGRRLDPETGLQYSRYRYYHAPLGRFVNPDPGGSLSYHSQIAVLPVGAYSPTASSRYLPPRSAGYIDGYNLYRYTHSNPVSFLDPSGLKEQAPLPKFCRWWYRQHPNLTPGQLDDAEDQVVRGCVGITMLMAGELNAPWPDMRKCFKSPDDAVKAKKKQQCGQGETPAIYSIHFWRGGGAYKMNPNSNTVDMGHYRPFPGRPPGDWNGDGTVAPGGETTGGVNFDFGWPCKCGGRDLVLHADMYHNPDKDGDGQGDYYPNDPIRDATCYGSTLQEWQASYRDFDSEVWCVICKKKPGAP